MMVSVHKRFPLPPAIVIEMPNNSPGQSSFGSNTELVANPLIHLSDNVECQWYSGASSPFTRHTRLLSPKQRPTDSQGRNFKHFVSRPSFLIPQNVSHEHLSRHYSLRTSQTSMVSQNILPHYWSPCNCSKITMQESCFLGVPKNNRSLRHSQSLRSTKSCNGGTCVQRSCSNEHNCLSSIQMDNPVTNGEFSSSPLVSGHHKGSNPQTPTSPDAVTANKFLFNLGDIVDDYSHVTAVEPHVTLKHKQLHTLGMTPNYTNSEASYSHMSTNGHFSLAVKPARLLHRGSYRSADFRSRSKLLKPYRSASLTEFSKVDQLFIRTQETQKSWVATSGFKTPRGYRSVSGSRNQNHTEKYSFNRTNTCCNNFHKVHGHNAQQRSATPIQYHVRSTAQVSEPTHPYDLPPVPSKRRHTDGSDVKPIVLSPVLSTRRANSFSYRPSCSHIPSFCQSPTTSCILCHQPQSLCSCVLVESKFNSTSIPVRTVSKCESLPDLETGLTITDELTVSTNLPKEHINGLCFCQLIVLLVTMQIVLGLSTTALGLYLHWRVPRLPLEECAFWAASPITLTGLIGIYFCVPTRLPFNPNEMMACMIRRAAGILSLISCVVCLVASIFSGQKGSLIAAYGDSCAQRPAYLSSASVYDNHNNSLSLSNTLASTRLFQQPCCLDGLDPDGTASCQCFNVNNQLMWSYHQITCRFLFSSVKDYLILQCALMGVGAGVCLWFWVVLTEQQKPGNHFVFGKERRAKPDKKSSISSTKNYPSDTTTTTMDGVRSSVEILEQPLRLVYSRREKCGETPGSNTIICSSEHVQPSLENSLWSEHQLIDMAQRDPHLWRSDLQRTRKLGSQYSFINPIVNTPVSNNSECTSTSVSTKYIGNGAHFDSQQLADRRTIEQAPDSVPLSR
ncbi:hypothetical protein EG68_00314 [Paragonimus skrjabini miyazakii]|uniref:Sarcospan n=1 Tax=Paragonimus skrjabini miyazakii TaxID=59628 RepID=A0A8S9ZCT7_9TREM|nr:hypothetical protein EG68_00314 [Paragonimus skrjabini miyazakii]